MKKILMIGMISFIAFVKTPLGLDRRYVVESFEIMGNGQIYRLNLKEGISVYVPVIFTILEDHK